MLKELFLNQKYGVSCLLLTLTQWTLFTEKQYNHRLRQIKIRFQILSEMRADDPYPVGDLDRDRESVAFLPVPVK